MDYEEYEKSCDEIRKENAALLGIFEDYLVDKGLSQKTVNRHIENVDFYINDYLLYSDALPMEDGVSRVDDFLGYFFIRKCMWSTPGTIKSTTASIKKFYKCMADNGRIPKDDYDYLCRVIKDNMSEWQSDCEQYNDPDAPSPFSFF